MHLKVSKKAFSEFTKTTIKMEDSLRAELEELVKKKRTTMSSLIRSSVLRRMIWEPLGDLAPKPPENSISLLSEVSPDAIVYQAPASDIKIVAAPYGDGGWRGIIFNPLVTGSLEVWNSDNLNIPVWAKTKNILKTLLFITSRVDSDGMSYFDLPNSVFAISSKFENGRWNGGEIIDSQTKKSAPWIRDNYMSHVDCATDPHRWGCNRNVRRYLTVLTTALRCGDGGLK